MSSNLVGDPSGVWSVQVSYKRHNKKIISGGNIILGFENAKETYFSFSPTTLFLMVGFIIVFIIIIISQFFCSTDSIKGRYERVLQTHVDPALTCVELQVDTSFIAVSARGRGRKSYGSMGRSDSDV